jgi:hypothetical protein
MKGETMKPRNRHLPLLTVLYSLLICLICLSCASNSGNASRRHFRETPVVVKAAFDTLDPVFRQNLKPNAAIAVFPISTTYNIEDAEEIYEQLQINVVNSDRYTIVEKRHVDQLLDEHDFQRSGLVSDASAITFGRLLGADAVILGSVTGRGSDRRLSLIAVDMERRATLATADEPWPQVSTRADTRAPMPANMGLGNVLFLPVIGGTGEENSTLKNLILRLRDINDACNLIDESQNTSIIPANFTGTSDEDNALLFNLGLQYKANFVIFSNIQKFGQRNLAVISRYNVYAKQTDGVYYQEYIDPVEAWIKLPGVISTIMKGGRAQGASEYYFWVRYRDGLDRVLAERAINLLISDFAEASGGKTILVNKTADLETAVAIRQDDPQKGRVGPRKDNFTPPRTEIPNNNWRGFIAPYFDGTSNTGLTDAMAELHFDVGITGDPLNMGRCSVINVSRQGNRTRFQIIGNASLDFTDMQDFVRQMRGLSLSIANGRPTAGYDLSIVQGVKYNYWKYAEEDSTIPDIVTYINKFPRPQNIVVASTGFKTVQIRTPGNVLFYYAKENDFSKAKLADTRWLNSRSGSVQEIYNLERNTNYFIWPVSCWGYLMWLQSDPGTVIPVKTQILRDEWADQVMWDR